MRIAKIEPQDNFILLVHSEDGRSGTFDVSEFFDSPVFERLKESGNFTDIINGGYFIEWKSGADLSADTIEARWEEAHS